MTPGAYFAQLKALLPRGPLWRLTRGGTFEGLLRAIADGLFRVRRRALDLQAEADPRTTYELLPEWEASCGLPDGCLPNGGTLTERRNAVVARINTVGGVDAAYFVGLAAQLGFEVTVVDTGPNVIRMDVPDTISVSWATAGGAVAGDPIRSWGNSQLECLINRYKPAHIEVQFAYGEP